MKGKLPNRFKDKGVEKAIGISFETSISELLSTPNFLD
jgi:hypothetical protein